MHLRLKFASIAAAFLLLANASFLAAQDYLTVGGATCPTGSTGSIVQVPVYIRDASGTTLGTDRLAAAPIQAFGFRVVVSPPGIVDVRAVTVVKAGIARLQSSYESLTSDPAGNSFTYVVAFNGAISPLRFSTDASLPGNLVATISIPIPISPRATTIGLTVDTATLANASGSITETVASRSLRTVGGCITICNPVAITTQPQPQSQTIAYGYSATFSVTASGTSPTYQWYNSSSATSGATSATYTTPPMQRASTCWVRVTNNCSTVDSDKATITVTYPTFTVSNKTPTTPWGKGYWCNVRLNPSSPIPVGVSTGLWNGLWHGFSIPANETSWNYLEERGTAVGTYPITVWTDWASDSYTLTVLPFQFTLTPSSSSIQVGGTQYFDINFADSSYLLKDPIVFSVASSDAGVATLSQSSVTIPAGYARASFRATGLALGQTTITATLPPEIGGTQTAALNVVPPCTAAAITTQPANASIPAGSTATLRVVATGTDLHYQWYEGTAPSTTTPVGTDSASLTTPALTATKSYWVRVSNSCSSVNSATATVTVTYPSISLTPASASTTVGKTQAFTVTLSPAALIAATVTLTSSSTAVATGPASVSIAANTASATFNATAKAAGSATITATLPASLGSGKATASLTVTAACTAAAITTQPASTTIPAGSTATLRVVATGTTLHHQWYEGTAPSTTKPAGTDSATLTTPALTATKSYWVRVSNTCSSVNSATATITVTTTTVTLSSSTTTVPVGTSLTYTVKLSAAFATATAIALSSSNTAVATVPASVTIAASATTATFVATTLTPGTATITATLPSSLGGGKATSSITVSPLALTLTPATATINVGATQPLTIALGSTISSALTVALASNNKPVATVPASVAVAAGAATAKFNVTGVAPGTATITATLPAAVGGASKSSTITVSIACLPASPPVPSLLGTTQSRVPYTVSWGAIGGASRYQIQESVKSDFSTTRISQEIAGTAMEFTNVVTAAPAVNYYYRVRAIKDCNTTLGSFSATVTTLVQPDPEPEEPSTNGLDGTVSEGGKGSTTFIIHVDSPSPKNPLDLSFSVTTTAAFLTASPSSGTLPPAGVDITITANPTGLPLGSTTGTVTVTSSTGATLASVPVSLSVIAPVKPIPRDQSPTNALIVPAVAHVDTPTTQFVSDVRIANIGTRPVTYQVTYTQSGTNGMVVGRQTAFTVAAGQTVALNDVVRQWFGESANSGALEIRPLTAGVADDATVVTSRTYAKGPGGTFGQFVPAVPFREFIDKGHTFSIQHLSQSTTYRTNLGFVEASGHETSVRVRVNNAAGQKIDEFTLSPPLAPAEFRQINKVLESRKLTLSDGTLEIDVLSDAGKLTAYASVLDNRTDDPFLVTPVEVANVRATRYVVPGVADLRSSGMSWRTDLRVYNSAWSPVTATMTFYPDNAPGSPIARPLALGPREMKVLDNLLATTFSVKTDTKGAVHVTTAVTSSLVVTARTYDSRPTGTYGQFIAAVTPEEGIGAGERAIQLLQLEQSPRYRTNLGITELSGNTAYVEVTAFIPGEAASAPLRLELKPNQALQVSKILTQFTAKDAYNARISVGVTGGSGKVAAYASIVDARTSDPTYVPAQ